MSSNFLVKLLYIAERSDRFGQMAGRRLAPQRAHVQSDPNSGCVGIVAFMKLLPKIVS